MAAETMAAAGAEATRLASRTAARYLDGITAIQERLAAVSSSLATLGLRTGRVGKQVKALRARRPELLGLARQIIARNGSRSPVKSLSGAWQPWIADRSRRPAPRTEIRPSTWDGPAESLTQAVPSVRTRTVARAAESERAETRSLDQLTPQEIRDRLIERSGRGEPLDYALRRKFVPHLQFDPAMARIHTGEAAVAAAISLRAEAFTIGRDVFFGRGRFDTQSKAGLGLLAHELTHVRQQAAGRPAQMRFFTASGGDRMEREAQQVAASVIGHNTGTAAGLMRAVDTGPAGAPPSRGEDLRLQDYKPAHASLGFALVMPHTFLETLPETSQTATTEPGSKDTPSAAKSSVESVANRVYELMRREVEVARLRGMTRQKG